MCLHNLHLHNDVVIIISFWKIAILKYFDGYCTRKGTVWVCTIRGPTSIYHIHVWLASLLMTRALFFSSLQPRITEFENHGIQRWEISSSLTNTYKFFLTFSQDELIQEMFDAIFLQSKKLLYHGMWPMWLHILECLQNNFRFFIELFLICRPSLSRIQGTYFARSILRMKFL